MKNTEQSQLWFKQAQSDHKASQWALKGKFYSHCCFVCQQSAEKYLKAYLYLQGQRVLPTHSVRRLVIEALDHNKGFKQLQDAAKELDKLYQQTRYPDALPDGAPFEYYTLKDANEALEYLKEIADFVQKALD